MRATTWTTPRMTTRTARRTAAIPRHRLLGMSLGGIIEDFIDNMDGYDQDLLEDFLLTIDDSLDIA